METNETALTIESEMSFDQWRDIGKTFGASLQSAAWYIGDWLVYGERKWSKQLMFPSDEFDPDRPGRIPSDVYDQAVRATGLDRNTSAGYATVCRKIPPHFRDARLSFAHHRVLAALPADKALPWFALLKSDQEVEKPTVKRLALSVRTSKDYPRMLSTTDIADRKKYRGRDNYVPHLARLLVILREQLPKMDDNQREAVAADFSQLVEIIESI